MPAIACHADAAIRTPCYGISGEIFLPAGDSFLTPSTATTATAEDSSWSPNLSAVLYRIDGWGAPYFTVNPTGNVSVRPHGAGTLPHQEIDLLEIVKKVSEDSKSDRGGGLGLHLPFIVRFPHVLKNRLESLQSAFDFAIKSHEYQSHYQGVYPVKCNQDRFVVEDIVRFGSGFRFGLECGSKPELLLAMSCLCEGNPEALLICNGFKDSEYISLAVLGRKMALNTVIVLEQEEEIDLVIHLSEKLSVKPVIGIRVKLRTKHSGHFGSTSGEKGKFGLNPTQILRVIRRLERSNMLGCLQLLHFHIGSQIPTTDLLSDGVAEATQIYCELVRLGAGMRILDVGGGLGIDYDGSRSGDSDFSVAYGFEEYATAVVGSVLRVCDRRTVPHPIICSESGRAIVSHHSVLIFEAVSASAPHALAVNPTKLRNFAENLPEDARADYRSLTAAAFQGEYETCLYYTNQLKQRCVEECKEGNINIEQLAAIDGLCEVIPETIGGSDPVRIYHVNLSVFTSIPDFWGIDQRYPIIPIHKLDQRPKLRGILSDLTCDSDGKIDKFIGGESSLPLHELHNGGGEKYFLGMFLGGAYEEALGGVHNLFGGPSVVRVEPRRGCHGFSVTRVVSGPVCADVLRMMQFEPEVMLETLKHRAEKFYGPDDGDDVTRSLARSFHNTPYLVTTTAAHCSFAAGIGNNGFYYYDGDEDDDGESA